MPSRNLIAYDPPKMLTMREARVAGQTANRLTTLRNMLEVTSGGSLTVSTRSGTASLSLTSVDMEAVLALLIERDVAFLTGLNIETTE